MAPKRASSRALNTKTQKTTGSRRSASVASTGTRRSARLAGEDASDAAPPEQAAAASTDVPVETATLAVITEGSDDDEAPSPDTVEVQQQLEDKDPSTATATEAAAASSDALVETATVAVINEGLDDEATSATAPPEEPAAGSSDAAVETAMFAVINESSKDEASVPEAVQVQQQHEDKEPSIATADEAALFNRYDESLADLAYPEDDPELEPTESQEIEASTSLPLQPTIYDYSAPEETQPTTSQLPDQSPPPQPRTISTTKADALLKRIAKLGKKLIDEDAPASASDDSSSGSEAEPDPANAPEEVYTHRQFWPTDMGPDADDKGAPKWYAAAKGLAWGFYQQRKDIAHCAKLYPRAEAVLKNIEASCLREKLFQDRLMVYFREHMADKSGEEGETAPPPPPPAPFLSSEDIYGVTVSEMEEEMERIAAKAGESSLKHKESAGTKRSREEEDEEEEEKDVESEREPRRQKLTH